MAPTRLGVAAPNAMATAAATALAEAGGSAVDAAVAATLVAMVTEPGVVSLGGGAFVTVGPPGSEAVTVDGSVEMPGRSAPPDAFGGGVREITTTYGGGLTTTVGHGSVGTPGALAALDLAHRRFGRVPWAAVVEPAVAAARTGSPLGVAAASYLGLVHELIFGADPASHAAVHHPDGTPLVAGDTVLVADLADSLAQIANEGAAVFYRGDLARAITDDMAANGGLLGADDLAGYEPVIRPTLTVDLVGWHLSTNPPPAIGGAVLGAMLLLLGDHPVPRWTADERARLAVIMAAVLRERVHRLDTADDRTVAAELLVAEIRTRRTRLVADLAVDRPRLGRRRRGPRVRDHHVRRVRLGRDDARHRDLAEQLPRRARTQPSRPARLATGHAVAVQHGADRRSPHRRQRAGDRLAGC